MKNHLIGIREDIMFSILPKIWWYKYFCSATSKIKNLWSSDYNTGFELGNDENASFKLGNHYFGRDKICEYCINNGWKTVNNIK